MKFEQVCQKLNEYFTQKHVIRILLPISVPIMFICVALLWLGNFISLGSVTNTICYLGFWFAVVMVLSVCNFRMTAAGFGVYALLHAFNIVRSLIRYHSVDWSGVIYLVLYMYFAYQSYKKSLQINK